MAAISFGAQSIIDAKFGGTNINAIYYGSAPIWNRPVIYDDFNIIGLLTGWINELLAPLVGLYVDLYGIIRNALGDIVGNLVAFIPALAAGNLNAVGALIANTPGNITAALCGGVSQLGGFITQDLPAGLIGFFNEIPIVGGQIYAWLNRLPGDITSLIGTIPVIGDLAKGLGLLPQANGAVSDPVNFVTNQVGGVVGTLSCGTYAPKVGPAADVGYVIGVPSMNMARMLVPDGLVSLDPQTSRFRWPSLTTGDDGYVETQIANIGSPGFVSQLFRRYDNTGSFANGVGIDLTDSAASIVRRVAGVETLMTDQVSFVAGDVLRLVQAGNTHDLLINGNLAVQWVDNTATAAVGAANRSVAMMMQGAKQQLGTRLFSPAFNYVSAA